MWAKQTTNNKQTTVNKQAVVARLLQERRIPPEELKRKYPGLVSLLVRTVGRIPAGLSYFELWEPAFEAHNLIFPVCADVPRTIISPFAKTQARMLGLTAFWATLLEGNAVGSAHSLTFLLRSGMSVEKVSHVRRRTPGVFTPKEEALLDAVTALFQAPESFQEHKIILGKLFGWRKVERYLAPAFTMSLLNKAMGGLAVELEQDVADVAMGVLAEDGWEPGIHGWLLDSTSSAAPPPRRDTLWTNLKLVPHLPAGLVYAKKCVRGVPSKWPAVGNFLKQHIGYSFPQFERFRNPLIRQAAATVVAHNTDPALSLTGLHIKCLVAVMYAELTGCHLLDDAVASMCEKFGATTQDIERAKRFATQDGEMATEFENKQVRALLQLGKAVATTPCHVSELVIDWLERSFIAPSIIVELVMWVAVLHMLNRMLVFLN